MQITEGVLGKALAKNEPPELLHVVRLVSLSSRRAHKYHHWLVDQIGLQDWRGNVKIVVLHEKGETCNNSILHTSLVEVSVYA